MNFMPHNLHTLIRDMQKFVFQLQRFIAGRSLSEIDSDDLSKRAIEMQFILIGEVIKRMERVSPVVHARIGNIRDISGLRNTIVHDYDEVDWEIVWDSATFDIPVLKEQIDAWAVELGMPPFDEDRV